MAFHSTLLFFSKGVVHGLRLRNHSLGVDNIFEERAYGKVCYLRNTFRGYTRIFSSVRVPDWGGMCSEYICGRVS